MRKTIYQPLADYLLASGKDDLMLTFTEIEDILGFKLSPSHRKYRANWSNNEIEALSWGWRNAGYESYGVDMKKEIAHFRKVKEVEIVDLSDTENPPRKVVYREYVYPEVPSPTENEVEKWLHQWDELEDYIAQEDAIDRLFHGEFAKNDNLQNILIKCSVLNDFYSTNIFKIYPVAKHILSLNIDERLKAGDPTLVNDIAKVNFGENDKNFYSFASKYCSHHNQLDFPIYDSYVRKVLQHFKRRDRFASFAEYDLKNYRKFKEVLIRFRSFYKLDKYNLKELDKFLWQFGKQYFPNSY